ncbi:MAG: PAS domain S-box protein, partial [Thermoanaerobaculia bacterium]
VAVIFEDVTAPATLEHTHEFQARLLDAVEQAVIATDVEGRITYWNRFAESLYGWSAGEAVGLTISNIMVPPGLEDQNADIARSVVEHGTWSGELAVLRKDGRVIPVFVVLSPMKKEGVDAGIISVSHDLAAQKKSEEVLRRSEARYRALVSAIPDVIFRFDSEGRYIDYAGPESLLIIPKAQFIGRRIRDILPPSVSEPVEKAIRLSLESGFPTPVEYEMEVRGERRTFETIIAPNGPSEVVAVRRDVTDRKRVREALDRLLIDLEKRVEDRTRDLTRVNDMLVEQIARRESAEEALRSSYARLQTLIDATPAAIVEISRDGTVLSWSEEAERMFGWTAAEVIGRSNPVVPEDRIDESRAIMSAAMSGVGMSSLQLVRRNRTGESVHVNLSAASVRDAHGMTERFVFVYTKPETTSSIEDLESKLTKLKSLSTVATANLDMNAMMKTIQRELSTSFGIEAGAVFARTASGALEPRQKWGGASTSQCAVAEGAGARVIDRATGRVWLRVPLRHGGKETGLLVLEGPDSATTNPDLELLTTVAHDVSIAITNASLFEEARNANERLQELSHRLLVVQEQERRHLGRELHDQIGQMLTGLKLRLASLHDSPPTTESLDDAEALVGDLMARIRTLTLELRPPMLDDRGLVAALVWHTDRYAAETGIEVDFRHSVMERLDNEIEIAAFRIIQEAMTNAARHAHPSHVRVRAWLAADRLLAEIEDDGSGFASSSVSELQTAGLTGMRERAALVGGTIVIDSTPGIGTRIAVDLPARRV